MQNDANLNTAAGGNGNPGNAGGFSEQPAYLNGPGAVNTHGGTIDVYQDNAAQTAFWSQFITGANQINNDLTAVAAGNTAGIDAFETQIQQYTRLSQSFDKSQGGLFGARFDNELLSGTEKTDPANAPAALHDSAANGVATANAAQALAPTSSPMRTTSAATTSRWEAWSRPPSGRPRRSRARPRRRGWGQGR